MSRGLSPETIRVRDSLVEKYATEPLETLSQKLQSLINDETETLTRLGVMAARVEILRMRLGMLTGRDHHKNSDHKTLEVDEADEKEEEETSTTEWMTLRISEASEVNGVRFPEGIIIDVHIDDAKKLLESNKAELISINSEAAKELLLDVENGDIDNEAILEEASDDQGESNESKSSNSDEQVQKAPPKSEEELELDEGKSGTKDKQDQEPVKDIDIDMNTETEVNNQEEPEKDLLKAEELGSMLEEFGEEPKKISEPIQLEADKDTVPNSSQPETARITEKLTEEDVNNAPSKPLSLEESEIDNMLEEFGVESKVTLASAGPKVAEVQVDIEGSAPSLGANTQIEVDTKTGVDEAEPKSTELEENKIAENEKPKRKAKTTQKTKA